MAISDIAKTSASDVLNGPPCSVCRALEELPEADANGLLALLSDPSRRFTEIADLVAGDPDTPEWIRRIHDGTYARHAKGRCGARTKLR